MTRRAFFCAVVVEGPNDCENLSEGLCFDICSMQDNVEQRESPDVQDLVASLGDTMASDNDRSSEEAGPSSAGEKPLPPIQVRNFIGTMHLLQISHGTNSGRPMRASLQTQ